VTTLHQAVAAGHTRTTPWYDDRVELAAFAAALVRSGVIADAPGVVQLIEAPAHWVDEHGLWAQLGRPDPDADDPDQRSRWCQVEALARHTPIDPPQRSGEVPLRSQTLRRPDSLGGGYFVRVSYGPCSVCEQEMWDLDERGLPTSVRPAGDTHHRCATCAWWSVIADADHGSNRVIVDGWHYLIAGTDDRVAYPRRVVVEFFDGRRVETYSLICQGEIPPAWRSKLPDNARLAGGR
jgi:hypothetical protein